MLTDGNICAQKRQKKHPIVKNEGNGYDFRDAALWISTAREFHSCLSVQGHLAFWKLWIGKYTVLLPRKRAQIALHNRVSLTSLSPYDNLSLLWGKISFQFFQKNAGPCFRNVAWQWRNKRINPTTPQNKQHQLHNSLSSCQYWYTSVPVTTAP